MMKRLTALEQKKETVAVPKKKEEAGTSSENSSEDDEEEEGDEEEKETRLHLVIYQNWQRKVKVELGNFQTLVHSTASDTILFLLKNC